MEGVHRDFKYGLQNIHVGLVGDMMGRADGSIEWSGGQMVDISKLEGNEEEKHTWIRWWAAARWKEFLQEGVEAIKVKTVSTDNDEF